MVSPWERSISLIESDTFSACTPINNHSQTEHVYDSLSAHVEIEINTQSLLMELTDGLFPHFVCSSISCGDIKVVILLLLS